MPDDTYHLETYTVTVEVSLGGGASLVGQMFLRPLAAGHGGRETVADRLNDGSPFFPLRVLEPVPATVLVGKAQVRYVLAPTPAGDERIALQRAAASQIGVTAVLDDGQTVSGILFIDLPPGHTRTLDYITLPDHTFVEVAQPERDCFINRSRVRYFRDAAR